MIYRVVKLSTGKYRLQFRALLLWSNSSARDFSSREEAESYYKTDSVDVKVLEKYPSFKVKG